MKNIIITGGAGFIGSHVVRLFVNKYPEYHIINLDKLTYAGNLANLKDIEDKPNYTFVKGDICDFDLMLKLMQDYKVDGIIHLAAESHVDRSIKDPFTFAQTNVLGTLSLLQAAKICHLSSLRRVSRRPLNGILITRNGWIMLLLGSIRSIMRICIRIGNIFFRKPTLNGLYTPFGSPVSGGQKPSLPLRKAPPFSPSLSLARRERM